jgi:hypothetical protein
VWTVIPYGLRRPYLPTGWLIRVICVCIDASSTFNHHLVGPLWRTHQKMTCVSLAFTLPV